MMMKSLSAIAVGNPNESQCAIFSGKVFFLENIYLNDGFVYEMYRCTDYEDAFYR